MWSDTKRNMMIFIILFTIDRNGDVLVTSLSQKCSILVIIPCKQWQLLNDERSHCISLYVNYN